jgi:protocatechuate 3,4-dioxygenase beta subunit
LRAAKAVRRELLDVVGRVLDARGAPIANATVEIWQADSHGRYAHSRDRNPAATDTDFQGYGQQTTDAEGWYRFRTIKPAPYPTGFGTRTPHVHFQVTGGDERKVTQMFFPGEPLNEQDSVLRGVSRGRDRLFARIERVAAGLDSGATRATFDIVLGG